MGKQRTYRWYRRKQRLETNQKQFSSLHNFQVLLLGIVFFLFAVGFKILAQYAIISSVCLENTALFGASSDGLNTWQMLKVITELTILFGVIITVSFWSEIRKQTSMIFQSILFACLLILHSLFNNMIVTDIRQPDVIINVERMVRSPSQDAPNIYDYTPLLTPETYYTEWHQGKIPDEYFNATFVFSKCVWLDENRVADGYQNIDGYSQMLPADRLNWYEKEGRRFRILDWRPMPLKQQISLGVKFIAQKPGHKLSDLLKHQDTRPLLAEERARAIKKLECIKNSPPYPNPEKMCSFVQIVHIDDDSMYPPIGLE